MPLSKKNTPKPFIIDDETLTDGAFKDKIFVPTIDGSPKGHGLVPRDYAIYPPEMFAPPSEMTLIDPSEIDGRIADHEKHKSSVRHLIDWPALDQGSEGFCWFYSVTGAVMAVRTINHQPYVRLSAHAGACKIKNFRNEGGWCGLAGKFYGDLGCPSTAFWPERSMNRSHDKPEVWANAALHKVTEDWTDLTRNIYDRNLTLRQIDTCALTNIPMAWDFPWWAHSVMGCGLKKIEDGSYGREGLNSWGPGWGDKGWFLLRGSKAIPSSAIALRVTGASPN